MPIRIGPAGIPLSCKGRTIKDGVIYTRNLELDAIQVQFVRGIRTVEEEALEVGRVAREANVEVHVHAPYYTNLAGDETNVEMAFDKIITAGAMADAMGARTLAIHCGLYNDAGPEKTKELITQNVLEIRDAFKEDGLKVKLGLETSGKQAIFGSLEEILDICRAVPGVVPILDFAHIHARTNGGLQTQEDFQKIFDACKFLNLDQYVIHFTGILYDNGNERHHLPIKKGDLRFEPLVECILDNDYNVSLISHSPILEHDAMYMKIVLDRVRERREAKTQREAMLAAQEKEKELLRKERERQALLKQKEKEKLERLKKKEQAAKEKAKADAKKKAEAAKKKAAPKKPKKAAAPKPKKKAKK